MLHPRLLCVPVSKVCPRLIASSWLTEGLVGLLYFQTVGEACDSGQEKNASDVPCSSSVYNQHPHPHPCHPRITILTSRGAFFKGFFFFFLFNCEIPTASTITMDEPFLSIRFGGIRYIL